MIKRILITLTLVLMVIASWAQGADPEMADVLRENGKIYVVLGVILIILTGFIVFLFYLDYKISSIEKKLSDKS